MVLVCDWHNYSNENKVILAAVAFIDYAISWWDQLVLTRRRKNELPISNWEGMKAIMRRMFVSSHYYKDLHLKLQSVKHGSKSMEEYHKEMEIAMIQPTLRKIEMQPWLASFVVSVQRLPMLLN